MKRIRAFAALFLILMNLFAYSQIEYKLLGESSLNQSGLKQSLGVNFQFKNHSNQLLFGVDKIQSATSKTNFSIGYYYSYLFKNSLVLECGGNLKVGSLLTSMKRFNSHVHYCEGKFLFEESIGIGYLINLNKLKKADIVAFTRLGFIYGHKDKLVHAGSTLIECNEPIMVVVPQIGIKYQYKIN